MGDLLLKNDFFEKLNQRIWNFCKVVVTESKCEENQPWKHPYIEMCSWLFVYYKG